MTKHRYALYGASLLTALSIVMVWGATRALAQTYYASSTPTSTNTVIPTSTVYNTTTDNSSSTTVPVPAPINSIVPTGNTGMTVGTTGMTNGTTNNAVISNTQMMTNPFTVAAIAPANEVVNIDATGNVLLRGEALSAGTGSTIMITSWGGTWTIRTNAATQVYPSTGTAGDLSGIPAGHFVGVVGTVAADAPFTIDATVVRDWTTNPIVETSTSTTNSNTSVDTTTTGSGTSIPGSSTSSAAPMIPASSSGATTSGGIPAGDTLYTGVASDVSNVVSGTFTLMDSSGTQYTVNVAQGATVWDSNGNDISLSSISQNDSVRIDASLQSDGTLQADVVRDTSI